MGIAYCGFGNSVLMAVLVAIPVSYFAGGLEALIAGLALGLYVYWGGRLTLWSCIGAALIYPAAARPFQVSGDLPLRRTCFQNL